MLYQQSDSYTFKIRNITFTYTSEAEHGIHMFLRKKRKAIYRLESYILARCRGDIPYSLLASAVTIEDLLYGALCFLELLCYKPVTSYCVVAESKGVIGSSISLANCISTFYLPDTIVISESYCLSLLSYA